FGRIRRGPAVSAPEREREAGTYPAALNKYQAEALAGLGVRTYALRAAPAPVYESLVRLGYATVERTGEHEVRYSITPLGSQRLLDPASMLAQRCDRCGEERFDIAQRLTQRLCICCV